MSDQRRFTLAMVLSGLVFAVWYFFIVLPTQEAARIDAERERYTVGQAVGDYIDDGGKGIGRSKPLKPKPLAGYQHVRSRSLSKLEALPLDRLGGRHIDALRRAGTTSTANWPLATFSQGGSVVSALLRVMLLMVDTCDRS